LDQPWLAPLRGHSNDGWKHCHANSRMALFSIAFQNAVDISDNAMLFSLLTVCCKTLLYSSGFFFFSQKAKYVREFRLRNGVADFLPSLAISVTTVHP
jgi:hypothetical protein